MPDQITVENAETRKGLSRNARRWLIAGAAFIVVVSVALTVAWQSRLALAESIVADALRTRGISHASFRISSLGFKSIEIRDLTIRPDLTARRIDVSYRLGELLSGQVQAIEVDGLRLNAWLGDKGLSLGAADPLLHQKSDDTSAASALPSIHLSDAAIHLVTPQGAFDATGGADLTQADAAAPIVIALPSLRLSEATAPARFNPLVVKGELRYDGTRLAFDADSATSPAKGASVALAKVTGAYDLKNASASAQASGQLTFAPDEFEPRDISSLLSSIPNDLQGEVTYKADLSFAEGRLTASGSLDATHASTPSLPLQPVALTAQWKFDGTHLSFDADGATSPSEGAGVALTKVIGTYDLKTASASAKASGQLAFAPESFEPTDISPLLADAPAGLQGDVTYKADLSFAEGKLTATGSLDAAHASASSIPLRPVALTANWQFDGQRLSFDADTRTSPTSGAGVALAKVTGHYDVETATAAAKATGHLDFAPGKFSPGDLSPTLRGVVRDLSGRAAYQTNFSFAAQKLTSSGTVTLSNVGFGVGDTTVAGVAGTIRLSNLLPPRTRGVQTLTVAHVETAVPLDAGTVKFEIGSGMKARLIEAAWPFTGGELTLTSPDSTANKYKLTVSQVDIEKLLVFVDVPGLSGTGTLSGNFPLKIVNGDPIITNGALSSSGSGVIIYNNEAADAASTTEQTQLLTQALKNFHYTELSGALDGNVNGNLHFSVGLRGANPSLYDGYPIHLNVNIEGSLADLIRRGTVGLRPLELIQSEIGKEKKATPK